MSDFLQNTDLYAERTTVTKKYGVFKIEKASFVRRVFSAPCIFRIVHESTMSEFYMDWYIMQSFTQVFIFHFDSVMHV